jgi:hypothetical protein
MSGRKTSLGSRMPSNVCTLGLGNSQNPHLDRSDFLLPRRQRRIPVAPEGAVLVSPLQPRLHGVGRLRVPVLATLGKSPRRGRFQNRAACSPPGVADISTGVMGIFAPAVTAGEKKALLAAEFRVSRQTLYAALAKRSGTTIRSSAADYPI